MRNECKVPMRLALLGTALVSLGFAQMMGGNGMMGPGDYGSGTPGADNGTMGSGSGMMGGATGFGMQGGMAGMGAGMGNMASDLAIGNDGTAYVMRATAVTAGNQQTIKRELLAVNPSSGNANWALQIDGTLVSEPVLAKDGTILLTTSEPRAAWNTAVKPALLIVAPAATSARVQARVLVDADFLSAPVITPDGQTIYVVAVDMPFMSGSQTASAGSTYLYAFNPGTGVLKFKVQLR